MLENQSRCSRESNNPDWRDDLRVVRLKIFGMGRSPSLHIGGSLGALFERGGFALKVRERLAGKM